MDPIANPFSPGAGAPPPELVAPDVYLGVAPLCVDARGRMNLAGEGEPIDWLTEMRRLPEDQMLDSLIARGAVDERQIRPAYHTQNDDLPEGLRWFYESLHAFVRAKVAVWHLNDDRPSAPEKWIERAAAYLRMAQQRLEALRAGGPRSPGN